MAENDKDGQAVVSKKSLASRMKQAGTVAPEDLLFLETKLDKMVEDNNIKIKKEVYAIENKNKDDMMSQMKGFF